MTQNKKITRPEAIKTAEGNLVLDSHKLSSHIERVNAWEAGERIAPVTVDMALTRGCGAMCSFCYAMMQEAQERSSIKVRDSLNLLDDFATIGVKGVSLISDGESTLSKSFIPFINHANQIGIDIGNATNGWELTPEKIDQTLDKMSWIRFTVAAGTPSRYSEIMYKGPKETHVFDRAMKHIKYAVDLKRKLNLKTTIGIQMVLMPSFADEIIPFAKLAVDLGVDYGVIKHCSDDEYGTLGVDYAAYDAMYPKLEMAESLSTENTKIIIKWQKIDGHGVSPYKRFYGPQFLLQISGSGLVAPSGMFFNARYSKFHIGNFAEQRFKDIFKSEHYWRVMNYLASPNFDARTMMGTMPIQQYVSVALDEHITGKNRISKNLGIEPLHKNFL